MNWLADPGLELTAAWTLAVIFVCAAVGKFLSLREFTGIVANYRILPDSSNSVVLAAHAIPVLEIAGGIGLLVPATRPPAAWLVLALLVVFTVALAVNLARGRTRIDCGCFAHRAPRPISWALVARNGLMIAADGLVLAGQGGRGATALDFVTGIGAALAFAMLYAATPMLSSVPFDYWAANALSNREAHDD